MGERAGSPWVGEPGRLSLEDSERFSDDRERLVCSKFDCFVILRKRELRFLLENKERALYLRPDSRTLSSSHFSPWGHPFLGPRPLQLQLQPTYLNRKNFSRLLDSSHLRSHPVLLATTSPN